MRAGCKLAGILLAAALTLAGVASAERPTMIQVRSCAANEVVAAVLRANLTPAADTIVLKAGCTYTFTRARLDDPDWGRSALPAVTAPLTLDGNGATFTRDATAPAFRFLTVLGWADENAGFTVTSLALRGGAAEGPAAPFGGAIAFGDAAAPWEVDHCTFEGNSSATFGGAIAYASYPGRSLAVSYSTFSRNTAVSSGGAVAALGPSVSLSHDRFEDNAVTGAGDYGGGGAVTFGGDTMSVADSVFERNTTASPYGGAIADAGRDVTVDDSVFVDNAGNVGAGIWKEGGGSLSVSGSTFTTNSGGAGTAIGLEGSFDQSVAIDVSTSTFARNAGGPTLWAINGPLGALSVENSTFSGNTTAGFGAIMVWGGSLRLSSSTVLATGPAVQLSNWNGVVSSGEARNSVLVSGGGALCTGWPLNDGGGNVAWGGGGCPGTMLFADPLLGPLASNGGPTQTMALGAGSPAVDHAVAPWPATDQRGVARPQGPAADSGAYER